MTETRLILLSILPLAMAAPAMAQEPETAEISQEEVAEIIVVGRGLSETPAEAAFSQIVLDNEAINSAPSGRIEDVLSNAAGFQQFRRSDSRSANPSAQGVTLRALGGNATSRALVLLDGVPMADPFFGYIPLTALAPERIGRIRVTRGGGSGPFGAGALAGTIELESRDPLSGDPITASLLANDRGATEASGGVTHKLGSGYLVADVRWDRSDGFYTTPISQRVPASVPAAFDSWSAHLRAVAPISSDVELQARGLIFRDDRTLRFDGADSASDGQDASLRIVGHGLWKVDALGYIQTRNFSNIVISSTRFVRVLDQRKTPSTGLGGKLEVRPPLGKDHILRLGADYRQSSGELQEESYSAFTGNLRERRRAGGRNSDLGLFAEYDWNAGPLALTGGLRADYTVIADGFYRAVDDAGTPVASTHATDRKDWHVNWRLGAIYDVSSGMKLRASAYSGLRLPTLNELYRPFVVFPVVTQANAGLENERLVGFEAGIDFAPSDNFQLSLTAFDNRVEDAIANVTLAQNLRQRRNLPAIKARGIEADLAMTLDKVSLNISGVYNHAEVEGRDETAALNGFRPSQTPEIIASATASWRPASGWLLSATLRHVGSQFEDDRETDILPAMTTLGAYARIPVTDKLALIFRGENLTDEMIVTRNAGGVLDLGVPRTFWAGLRWGY